MIEIAADNFKIPSLPQFQKYMGQAHAVGSTGESDTDSGSRLNGITVKKGLGFTDYRVILCG
jgi:hypothetical protein